MKKILKFWPFLVFAVACLVYYWKVFFQGHVPLPGDLMVGAYLPWLEYKWGFPTGVPVKNPLISDIFSLYYMWKSLAAEQWRNLQIPFWDPYVYSGYPLMATFHSAVFYPLNLIHVLLGDIRGWNFLVIFPSFASAVTMYLYLRLLKLKKVGAVVGSIIYAYCGFAISWAQFMTASQAMVWMPLVFIAIEKYFESKRAYFLYFLPLIFVLIVTSGHFQILVYMALLTAAYFLWKLAEARNIRQLLPVIIPVLLTVGISLFQILPTLELTKYGIRLVENYIVEYNYGLLPIRYLPTLLAPDFFGNAATGNFFGVFNYHEAIFYTGVLSVFGFFLSLFLFRSNKYVRFFAITAVISLLLGYDTPIGRAVYIFNVPGLSTSAAGRIAVIFSLSLSILSGIVVSNLDKINLKKIIFTIGAIGLLYIIMVYLARYVDSVLMSPDNPNMLLAQRRAVALRNLILPGALIAANALTFLMAKKWKVAIYLLIVVICLDMFRFGWKYIPFVPERIIYPATPVTDFLIDQGKTEIFRIDREKAEIIPPSTWMQYRLMSPSGYDPMAIYDYAIKYNEKLNGDFNGRVSRYSELGRYDAKALGGFNVKYLLVVKRDEMGKLGGKNISHTIDQKEWKKVFETEMTAILENTMYQPRVRFTDTKGGMATISSYTPNTVKINFSDGAGKTLLLADTWYPDWKAFVNGKETGVEKCEGIFRCVKLADDSGELVFNYRPSSFWTGFKISILSLIGTVFGLVIFRKKK